MVVGEEKVQLAEARLHASTEESPALRAELLLHEPLARRGEARVARMERAQREPREEARQQRGARAPDSCP